MTPRALPLVEVKGPPRQRGQQQGDGARSQIHAALEGYRDLLPKVSRFSWEEAQCEARKFLPYAENAFPLFIEELRGMAEGSGASFQQVWTLNCFEGLTDAQSGRGCTSIAVRDDHVANGHVLLAHNEDWSSVDRDNVYLVRATPDDGPAYVGMTYGPLLVNIGLNDRGIGVAINSVYANDVRLGVPRIVFSRAVLGSRTIGQAIRACVPKLRDGGYHYLLADAHGEMYSIETTARVHDITYGDAGWLAHTNHYISPTLKALEEPGPHAGSRVRLNRAGRRLQVQLGQVSVESLQSILRDHVNYPNSICGHPDPNDPPHERDMTIVSLVMDLNAQVMWAAPGPPCEATYVDYRF
jgi:isopenicillin-N N-acyltransferase-like protein